MKNNKTLRQILTGLNIGALAAAVIMTLSLVVIPWLVYFTDDSSITPFLKTWSIWISNEEAIVASGGDTSLSLLAINWRVAGASLAVLAIALISSCIKLGMFSAASLKETKSATALVLDILGIVCILLAIASIFVPLSISYQQYEDENIEALSKAITATQALAFCGSPVALALSAVNGVIAHKAAK